MTSAAIAKVFKNIVRGTFNQAARMVNTSNFVPSNNAFVRSEQAKSVYHQMR